MMSRIVRVATVAVAVALLVLVTSTYVLAAAATTIAQQEAQIPLELMEMIDTLLRLGSLALLVIPVTEVRRIFGGLPAIPLPGGNSITAGRWVSWLAGAAVLFFGHTVGWLPAPDFANFQGWIAIEWAILSSVANVIYSRWWRDQIGLETLRR